MTDKEIEILKDMRAYIDFVLEGNSEFLEALYSLYHDSGGLLRKEECFSPRSNGYAEYMKRNKSAPPPPKV